MKRAWSKMSRVISAMLVLGMFASVVPAQVLAVEEESAVVVEQQTEETAQAAMESAANAVSMLGVNGEDEAETCTITVEFHNCVNWCYDFPKWEHYVRTTQIEIPMSESTAYWNMNAAELANAVVGNDVFDTVDFWLNGQNQPVRKRDGDNWIAELYVNVHAWNRVPENYGLTYEKGDPWNENIVGTPLYRIQNMSEDISVAYSFHNAKGTQNGYLAPGEMLKTSLAVDGVAAAVFFVDVEKGFEIEAVDFSDGTRGDVFAIEDFDEEQGGYDFSEAVAQAKADGYDYAFCYTKWAANEDRWFKISVKEEEKPTPDEYTLTYKANNGTNEEKAIPVNAGEEVEVEDNTWTYDKHSFTGWNTEANGSGEAYKVGQEITLNADLTLYAQWKEDSEPTPTEVTYTVEYYKDNTDAANWLGSETKTGKVGEGTQYTSGKYLPEGYTTDKVTTSGATTIGADESKNVLNVVYGRRTDLSYTVNYIEDNTGKVLAGPDTVSGQTYGTEVTVYAKDIGGYSLMSTNPQKLSIGTGSNTITFYYREIGPDQPEVVTPSESPAPVAPVTPVTPRTPTTPTTTVTTPTATPAPDAGDADVEEEEPAEEEVIEEEETPLTEEPAEEETITDEETPLAESASGWALLNLILAIVTVIGAVVLVIGYFAGYQTIWRLLSLIPAIGGVVAFFLTEDMSLPMAFVDSWTLLMVIIAVVQVVIAIMAMKDKEDDEEA